MSVWQRLVVLASATALAAAIGGCSGSDPESPEGSGKVMVTWWHNASSEPGKGFWQTIANEYQATHPGVTIEVVPMQNEQFNTKLPVALQGGNPPDLYQQWGGGALASEVEAGKVLEITDKVQDEVASIGGAAAGWQVEGKQYALPYSLGIVGFWYNKDLFAKAGIDAAPQTWDDFLGAIGKLKAAGVAPIALGGKDKWPDAFYWDYAAVRMCSRQVMQQSAVTYDFSDPCWVKAGEKVKQLLDAQPFQKGFLGTPAQQGAGSSAGLLANGKAAMELQGHWNPGVMQGLSPDQKGLGDKLGWFPFPSMPDGAGEPGAGLGGGDGFSCSYKAPPECVDFLKYLVSKDVQTRWAAIGAGLPTVKGAEAGVKDPNLKAVLDHKAASPFVQLYLDVAYTKTVGKAVNDAIALQFAGEATPDQVVKAITDAASKR